MHSKMRVLFGLGRHTPESRILISRSANVSPLFPASNKSGGRTHRQTGLPLRDRSDHLLSGKRARQRNAGPARAGVNLAARRKGFSHRRALSTGYEVVLARNQLVPRYAYRPSMCCSTAAAIICPVRLHW